MEITRENSLDSEINCSRNVKSTAEKTLFHFRYFWFVNFVVFGYRVYNSSFLCCDCLKTKIDLLDKNEAKDIKNIRIVNHPSLQYFKTPVLFRGGKINDRILCGIRARRDNFRLFSTLTPPRKRLN